ncbi:MAG TPA: hypothetical protein VIL55_03775 [Naasia sp.]|jgi:hypothetical protein
MPDIGWARTVEEVDYARTWGLGGVDAVADSEAWAVRAGVGRQVVVDGDGMALASGILSYDRGQIPVGLNTPTNGRHVLICRRIIWGTEANRSVSVVALDHLETAAQVSGPAPSTYPAAFTQVWGVQWDQPLAWVWVTSANTTVQILEDLRKLSLTDPVIGRIRRERFASPVGAASIILGWNGSVRFQKVANLCTVRARVARNPNAPHPMNPYTAVSVASGLPIPLDGEAVTVGDATTNFADASYLWDVTAAGGLNLVRKGSAGTVPAGGWIRNSFSYLCEL